MKMLVKIAYNLLFLNCVYSWKNQLQNYSIYQVTAFNDRERSILYNLEVKNKHLYFLNGITNVASAPMNVIAKESCKDEFEKIMKINDIEYIKMTRSKAKQELKSIEDQYLNKRNYVYEKSPTLNQHFLDYVHITTWINNKLKKYSSVMEKIVVGDTFENRELYLLKISTGIRNPAVFILGGEQGRDWMSPAVILNYMDILLANRSDELIDIYDVYLMPVFNPDGYEYSMTMDRFWSKNRNAFYPQVICGPNDIAVGVNIDRNFYLNGSTYIPYSECGSIYNGHRPITEEESKALVYFLNTIAANMMAFITVRGFSNLITVPYAVPDQTANNYALLIEMLLNASDKVYKLFNVSYNICRTQSCFYNYAGNSPDWVKKKMNVPIVYTIFLNHDNTFLPRIEQVHNLTQHFTTIIQETLYIAKSIYEPLFNSVIKPPKNSMLIAVCLLINNY